MLKRASPGKSIYWAWVSWVFIVVNYLLIALHVIVFKIKFITVFPLIEINPSGCYNNNQGLEGTLINPYKMLYIDALQ